MDYQLSDFDYDLPAELIASHPAEPREVARLLDLRQIAGKPAMVDRHIADLPQCLQTDDLLVVNNTSVLAARLSGYRDTARVEVTLHKRLASADTVTDADFQGKSAKNSTEEWACFARPARKLRVDDKVVFADGFTAVVTAVGAEGERMLRFNLGGKRFAAALSSHGVMPLPPYIRRPQGGLASDAEDYQTVFAAEPGAVAAPTAGLHFTPALLRTLQAAGIGIAEITLHVGAGTFLPVKHEQLEKHRMHSEWGRIGEATAARINATRKAGGRIIAVGTTSLRILEACYQQHGSICDFAAETDLFIRPGFRFGVTDMLLTNFHLPRSTLLMLVSAFAGKQRIEAAYRHAIDSGYRFFSYGDACLLSCMAEARLR